MENTKIKEWYLKAYPTDEMGQEIDGNVTFMDLFTALDEYRDVYTLMNAHDSVIRERVFERLAEIMDCDYDYIYTQWLKGE